MGIPDFWDVGEALVASHDEKDTWAGTRPAPTVTTKRGCPSEADRQKIHTKVGYIYEKKHHPLNNSFDRRD
jgi:hypothetical protein